MPYVITFIKIIKEQYKCDQLNFCGFLLAYF
jgi:hypothetical protein